MDKLTDKTNQYILIFANQDQRTQSLLELENYFAKLIGVMEEELRKGSVPRNWDYSIKTESYMKEAQKLNSELRNVNFN